MNASLTPCILLVNEHAQPALARVLRLRLEMVQVEPLPTAMRPFVTFGAKNQLYYIEGHAIEDKGLLRRLLGRPLKAWEE